ncbi:uncharacterized protein LOC128960767 [Oppia nitens]|uniref:uncharacterized protein LOC128960767 n=1 Tax=Oppia nitens TaxID=1686743 RepID=UPI0023DB8795|nr:uncharacterized protein LOC128960767 [Oppia nitens]
MSIYDDHIYEELGHYQSSRQSRTSNDWIDIETNDQQKIRIEVILNRRSHLKANNNYKSRLSFKPKTNQIHNNNNNNNKRRSSRRPSMINVVYSDGSDSATEYEDIDDDDDDHNNEKISIKQHMSSEISDKSMVSLVSLNKNNDESQLRPISSDQRLSDHIYEEAMIDNNILMVNNDRKSCTDLQNKLVRELSLRLLDSKTTITTSTTIDGNKTIDECDKTTTTTTTTGNELYNDIRLETSCEPNIYTATPRRLPNQMMTKTDPTITSRLDSKTAIAVSKSIDAINSEIREKFNDKRLTIASNRNSSIYISPNYSQANDDNDNTNTNNNNFIINRRNQNNQYKLKPINSLNQFNQIPSPSSSPSPTTMSPTMRSELIQKHTSMVASIASYLEFDNNLIDYCPSGVGGDDDNSISSSSSSSNNWNWSPLSSEPLYQFYQKDVRRRAELWKSFEPNSHTSQSDYDEYEIYSSSTAYDTGDGCTGGGWSGRSGGNGGSGKNEPIKSMLLKRNISAMDFVGNGPNRTLWCHLPQVINSSDNLLSRLSDQEKRLQEAMFEIISSEASYYKSINILVKHFHNCLEFSGNSYQQILNPIEKKSLFSNILDISKTSCQLLAELEKRFQQNVLLYDICDILCDYAVNHFQPYIHYCAYQRDQEKLLTQLTQSRPQFLDVLQRLESNQICQNQALLSFLMLPMQRITRYPLLIDAVCQQLPETSPLLPTAQKSLGIMNQLVRKCNDETKKVQRMQELMETVKILHFNRKVKSCPIVKGTRYLVKKGSVTRLSPQLSAKKTIGKSSTLKWSKNTIYLYLFSDLLILAKKKSENYYSVFDYCNRDTVQLISLAANDGGAGGGGGGEGVPLGRDVQAFRLAIPPNYLNPAQLILLKNHQDKIAEYTINFNLESEKLRWIEAVSQPSSDNPNEVIYEEWDCPQVQCILSYSAQQTDEISLEETDVLNVFRKMNDGWFEGERLRDGLRGWFPSKYTEAIINQHVKARNMKLRHRLLMYTQSVIDEQKRMSFTS